jgi:subtilisin family serine protease
VSSVSKILPLKVADSGGFVNWTEVISGLAFVRDEFDAGANIRVVNCSFGLSTSSSSALTRIDELQARDILVVAAAGNGGADHLGDNNDAIGVFPAAFSRDNIVAVAATTDDDALTSFSYYGQTTVDLAAPGENIYTTSWDPLNPTNNAYYKYDSGTSFSSPIVAGAAVVCMAIDPEATFATVKSALLSTADFKATWDNKMVSEGRLNLSDAVGYTPNC